jgi:hypothetical protein
LAPTAHQSGRSKGDCDNEEDEDINPTAVPVLAKDYVAALAETTSQATPTVIIFLRWTVGWLPISSSSSLPHHQDWWMDDGVVV